MKLFLWIALIGYALCYVCDCLLAYAPGGRFQFSDINDNDKLSEVFDGMPLRNLVISIIAGVFAMMMYGCGYVALALIAKDSSPAFAYIMIPVAVVGFFAGASHHVFCGTVEWFYVRMNRTEEARQAILEFFKKTSCTMYIYYIGLVILSVTWLVAVLSGATTLPRWCCIFNVLPLYLLLAPFKLVGTGNLAGFIMFAGLLIFL